MDCNEVPQYGCVVNMHGEFGLMTDAVYIGSVVGDSGNSKYFDLIGAGQGWFKVYVEETIQM